MQQHTSHHVRSIRQPHHKVRSQPLASHIIQSSALDPSEPPYKAPALAPQQAPTRPACASFCAAGVAMHPGTLAVHSGGTTRFSTDTTCASSSSAAGATRSCERPVPRPKIRLKNRHKNCQTPRQNHPRSLPQQDKVHAVEGAVRVQPALRCSTAFTS